MRRRREYLGYISDGEGAKVVAAITTAEAKLLVELLGAVRQAVREGHQLSITVDPWLAGDGVNASIMFDPKGYHVEIAGRFLARRKK